VGTAGPSGGEQGDKRSAEDAREHVRRLRSLPVDQVLGDALFSLLHAYLPANSPGRSPRSWDSCGWVR